MDTFSQQCLEKISWTLYTHSWIWCPENLDTDLTIKSKVTLDLTELTHEKLHPLRKTSLFLFKVKIETKRICFCLNVTEFMLQNQAKSVNSLTFCFPYVFDAYKTLQNFTEITEISPANFSIPYPFTPTRRDFLPYP